MAYSYYRQRRSNSYGQYQRQGGRYTTRKRTYKKRASGRAKPASKRKLTTLKGAASMASKLKELDMRTKYGTPQKVVLKAKPNELLLHEDLGRQVYYHVVPVAETLVAFASQAPEGPKLQVATKSIYVTGVTLTFELHRDCPVEMDLSCGPISALLECPLKAVKYDAEDQAFCYESVDGDGQPRMSGSDDKSVVAAASSLYTKFGVNGTVFGGTVNSKILPSGNYVAGKRKGTHTGRVSLQFDGNVEGGQGGPSKGFVKVPIRVFWRFEKEVPVSDLTSGRYAILMAVKTQSEGPALLKPAPGKGAAVGRMYGYLHNVAVSASVRG